MAQMRHETRKGRFSRASLLLWFVHVKLSPNIMAKFVFKSCLIFTKLISCNLHSTTLTLMMIFCIYGKRMAHLPPFLDVLAYFLS